MVAKIHLQLDTQRLNFLGHGLNLGHLISHRAHSLRPIGARAYAPAGVCREK